jgi:hypothetical protein
MNTQTPRTDAYQYADYILNHYDRGSHEDKSCLAKSLIEHGYGRSTSKAEVERLEEQLTRAVRALAVGIAEVERLRSQLNRAIEIAGKIWADCSNGHEHTELAALKEEIK